MMIQFLIVYGIVRFNIYRSQHGGRLAEWQGPGYNWTILERTAFVEVTGRRNFGRVIYAVGWDYRSVILKVFVGNSLGKWQALVLD